MERPTNMTLVGRSESTFRTGVLPQITSKDNLAISWPGGDGQARRVSTTLFARRADELFLTGTAPSPAPSLDAARALCTMLRARPTSNKHCWRMTGYSDHFRLCRALKSEMPSTPKITGSPLSTNRFCRNRAGRLDYPRIVACLIV